MQQRLSYEGIAIFVAEVGGVLVASCSPVVVPNLARGGRPYGLIENVVTHGTFRKRGFCKQVLAAALSAVQVGTETAFYFGQATRRTASFNAWRWLRTDVNGEIPLQLT